VIVLAGVERDMKEPLLNSHIFQITRRAANYLKADQLLGERMELWSSGSTSTHATRLS
jgi:hypothetical protein